MPLRIYKCTICSNVVETFKKPLMCFHENSEYSWADPSEYEVVLSAPQTKFMEPRDPEAKEKGKSVPKDFNRIVKERARNHSRENEMDELIATNERKVAEAAKWLKPDGRRRKKIDDL